MLTPSADPTVPADATPSAGPTGTPTGAGRGTSSGTAVGDSPPRPSGPGLPGLRERKKLARREALIRASHELVGQHGLDAVTVEMICEQVGVSSRTFFNYFASKIDAVLGIQETPLVGEAAEVFATGGPTGDLLDDCAAVVGSMLDSSPIDLDRMALVMELAQREPALLVRQIAWFEERTDELAALAARRTGAFTPGATEKMISSLVILLVRSTLTRWELDGSVGEPSGHLPHVTAELRTLLAPAVSPTALRT